MPLLPVVPALPGPDDDSLIGPVQGYQDLACDPPRSRPDRFQALLLGLVPDRLGPFLQRHLAHGRQHHLKPPTDRAAPALGICAPKSDTWDVMLRGVVVLQ